MVPRNSGAAAGAAGAAGASTTHTALLNLGGSPRVR